MSIQLMNEISNNYHVALSVHRELADLFWFVYMPGYALWHEYQYLDESCAQRKVKRYISETYHTFMPDKLPKSANITEPLLAGKNRKSLKTEESWKMIKEAFHIYQEWEETSLQKYQQIAKELFSSGEISTFNFVGEIIKDVKAELVYLTDKIIELNAMDWDMSQIVAEQPDHFERYEFLIKNLLGKSEMFHHNNSALDAHSRVFFEKSLD